MTPPNQSGLAALQQVQQAKKDLQELCSQRIAQLAAACFFEATVAQYRCTPNGPPVSPAAYLLCRYKQSQQVSQSGISQDRTSASRSDARAQQLETLLDRMEQDIVDTPIASVADIQAKYGAQFCMFTAPPLDTRSFIFSAMTQCFEKAKVEVNRELLNPNSELGKANMQIQLATQRL